MMKELIHYQEQSDSEDCTLLRDDLITYFVLASILRSSCTDIYTNHESVIVCYSCPPFPVWVWCKDIGNDGDIRTIAECLKAAFPLEKGFSYNIGNELLHRLQTLDSYFHSAGTKMNLLSYRLDQIRKLDRRCDGGVALADREDLALLTKLWHDACLEMIGEDREEDDCWKRVLSLVEENSLFTWRNDGGEIVAITAKAAMGEYGKISAVYTLPQHRRKGYAISLVHAVTQAILNDGLVPVLYTNADYIASNACYRKIGYQQVGGLCTVCRDGADLENV